MISDGNGGLWVSMKRTGNSKYVGKYKKLKMVYIFVLFSSCNLLIKHKVVKGDSYNTVIIPIL